MKWYSYWVWQHCRLCFASAIFGIKVWCAVRAANGNMRNVKFSGHPTRRRLARIWWVWFVENF